MEPMELDMERLICLVKERPVLWDKSLDNYKARKETLIAWTDVCRELFVEYEHLDDTVKDELGKLVVKKWTNVKDNWVRFQKRMMEENASGKQKHRKYVYHKHLAFLQKNNKRYDTECSLVDSDSQSLQTSGDMTFSFHTSHYRNLQKANKESAAENDCLNSPVANSTKLSGQHHNPQKVSKSSSVEKDWQDVQAADNTIFSEHTYHHQNFPTFSKGKKRKMEDIEEKILKLLNTPEDRHMCFFKGILPSLRQLDEDEVLQFQVGVMEVLQSIRKTRSTVQSEHMGIPDYTSDSSTAYPLIVSCEGYSTVVHNKSKTTRGD